MTSQHLMSVINQGGNSPNTSAAAEHDGKQRQQVEEVTEEREKEVEEEKKEEQMREKNKETGEGSMFSGSQK